MVGLVSHLGDCKHRFVVQRHEIVDVLTCRDMVLRFCRGLVPESSTAVNLTALDWSDPDAVAEQGALVFNGKGQCSACHTVDTSAPKGRCPDLTDIGSNAASRVPGMDAKTYFIESLYEPAKYLVPGYGKIMPEIWKAPISLSRLEIEAVIAYLQSQGGEIDPTPFDEPIDRADTATAAAALPPLLTGEPDLGKKVFCDCRVYLMPYSTRYRKSGSG